MNLHILDTDTCILWFKGNPVVQTHVLRAGTKLLAVTTVTVAELFDGAYRSPYAVNEVRETDKFLRPLQVLPFTWEAARRFGAIRARRGSKPDPKHNFDLMNASIALVRRDTLVTNNTKDYRGLRGLKVVNWAKL